MSEPLLRVEHLCQYFGPNKAVDDVSFEIQKGEVFGLVGESGCGKTTTGRSIIKLYDITSGSIYFKGKRIAAGAKSYKDRIREARKECREASPERRSELEAEIAKLREEIRDARRDHEQCDNLYKDELVKEVREKYEVLLENAQGEEEKRIRQEYDEALRIAKENYHKLCVRMTEAMIYTRPDLVRALEIQLPVWEAG